MTIIMLEDATISLPEFKTVFDCEVYSIDFMATSYIDLSNPDPNILKRGFLVLERYRKPTTSEVATYLQKKIEHYLIGSPSITDLDFSSSLVALRDQDITSLLKADPERISLQVSEDFITLQRDEEQYLQANYFTFPAPLYIQQGKKTKEAEWYHDAFDDASLREKGMQCWFLVRLNYSALLDPQKVTAKINGSFVLDKEGTAYVMEQVCIAFSPLDHFSRLKEGTSRKVREAALEYLINLQKDDKTMLHS